jgi:hypothetical protein
MKSPSYFFLLFTDLREWDLDFFALDCDFLEAVAGFLDPFFLDAAGEVFLLDLFTAAFIAGFLAVCFRFVGKIALRGIR